MIRFFHAMQETITVTSSPDGGWYELDADTALGDVRTKITI